MKTHDELAILDALGLSGKAVTEITIHMKHGDLAQATVSFLFTSEMLRCLEPILKKYELVEKT